MYGLVPASFPDRYLFFWGKVADRHRGGHMNPCTWYLFYWGKVAFIMYAMSTNHTWNAEYFYRQHLEPCPGYVSGKVLILLGESSRPSRSQYGPWTAASLYWLACILVLASFPQVHKEADGSLTSDRYLFFCGKPGMSANHQPPTRPGRTDSFFRHRVHNI